MTKGRDLRPLPFACDGSAVRRLRRRAVGADDDLRALAEPVALDGVLERLRLDLTAPGEPGEDGERDAGRVDVEEPARGRTGVGEAEPVGAQRAPLTRYPLRDLVGYGAHEV